jgi:hypothetical protein
MTERLAKRQMNDKKQLSKEEIVWTSKQTMD